MPTQALGAPPPDLQPGEYQQQYQNYPAEYGDYPRQDPSRGSRRPGRLGSDRSKLVDWTLKGLGLVGVALVSGFLWYLIRNNPAQAGQTQTQTTTTPGLYAFQQYADTATNDNCVSESTDHVKTYLSAHPCVGMTRSLFTASLTNGDKVITSIAVVKMRSSAAAHGLQSISDATGTGHIRDQVEDGFQVPGGPDSLQNGGYFSTVKGARFIVVMTEYVDNGQDTPKNLTANQSTLIGVSTDAAKQGLGGAK